MARKRVDFDFSTLKGKIVEKFGTIKNFAENIGVDKGTISNKLNGRIDFTVSEIFIWSNALNIQSKDYHYYFFTPKVG